VAAQLNAAHSSGEGVHSSAHVDAGDAAALSALAARQPHLVIHTAGRFVVPSHLSSPLSSSSASSSLSLSPLSSSSHEIPFSVARSCIAAGANYVDLADNRAWVCGVAADASLDAAARAAGVAVIAGASTVPGLSRSRESCVFLCFLCCFVVLLFCDVIRRRRRYCWRLDRARRQLVARIVHILFL
jgi:hypothetical protein